MNHWRATLDSFQLLRCLLAGGPGLARPFDVEDPPLSCSPAPAFPARPLPAAPPATITRHETFDEALDRFAFVNRISRAELDHHVFNFRVRWWREMRGDKTEPIATDQRIITDLGHICAAWGVIEEERDHEIKS